MRNHRYRYEILAATVKMCLTPNLRECENQRAWLAAMQSDEGFHVFTA